MTCAGDNIGTCEECNSRPAEPGSTLCLECRINRYKMVKRNNRDTHRIKIVRTSKWKSKKANKPDGYRNISGKVIYSNIGNPSELLKRFDQERDETVRSPPTQLIEGSADRTARNERPAENALLTECAMGSSHCPICGTMVQRSYNYCGYCGGDLRLEASLRKSRAILQKIPHNDRFCSIESLRGEGFEGFFPISKIREDLSMVPKERGIYLALCTDNGYPGFMKEGTGGWFKGKNPNVEISELGSKWVEDTVVLYIGQAGGIRGLFWSDNTLRGRIKSYLEFGQGRGVGHWGGRYIWQIKNSENLLLSWRIIPKYHGDPREIERQLLAEFRKRYGKLPFANLKE